MDEDRQKTIDNAVEHMLTENLSSSTKAHIYALVKHLKCLEEKLQTADNAPAGKSDAKSDIAPDTKLEVPLKVFVVVDSGGFVGAFLSQDAVARLVLDVYPGMNFAMYVFPLSAQHPTDNVFIIPYQGTNAIAFVSNDQEKCKQVHGTLAAIGYSFDDDIDFWRHPIGILCAPAKKRLDHLKKGADTAAGVLEEQLFQDSVLLKDGPIARLLRETERITILDSIVPVEVKTVPDLDRPEAHRDLELPASDATSNEVASKTGAITQHTVTEREPSGSGSDADFAPELPQAPH